MAYEFHYTPTGTGVISGKEVLEQTEDAINDLGNTAISGVQEALDKAEQALTNSANAVDDAQTALNTANNAEGVAIQAQTDVGNLSGTVTNIGNRVTTAEGNISNLQGRMTTAEGNITNLQGRMTTAETNIGNLQTAVSTAQATANSAQQTATTARQQAYVLRYSSTAITDNSTIAYSTLDNTDNIKASDKIIDTDGKIFSIVSVDSANETVTVGSALIDLAQDSDVMHLSGNETANGEKVFGDVSTFDGSYIGNEASTNARTVQILESNRDTHGQSGIFLTKFRQNKTQGSMSGNDIAYLSFDCLENSVRTNNGFRINFLNFVDDIPQRFMLWSGVTERLLGVPGSPWSDVFTNKINSLNPGALCFPDLNNGIDISSYITDLTGTANTYTVLVNGYIQFDVTGSSVEIDVTNGLSQKWIMTDPKGFIPVVSGASVSIKVVGTAINNFKFIPCQGNV